MCGRYVLEKVEGLQLRFGVSGGEALAPRYNIAPRQLVPVILDDGERRLAEFQWGLVPFWAKDPAIGNRMINARAESLEEKPAFRNALKQRRCLIPADGFYEWSGEGKARRPLRFHRPDGDLFAFAGLWERWQDPNTGADLYTCTIITCDANGVVAPVHSRMPVILQPAAEELWLDQAAGAEDVLPLLAPYPERELVAEPASRRVNSPANEGPSLLHPDE